MTPPYGHIYNPKQKDEEYGDGPHCVLFQIPILWIISDRRYIFQIPMLIRSQRQVNKVSHRHRVGLSVSVNVSSTTPSSLAWWNNLEHKRSYFLFAIHPVNGRATCSILYRFLSCSRHIERIDLAIHRCTPFPKSPRVRFIHGFK